MAAPRSAWAAGPPAALNVVAMRTPLPAAAPPPLPNKMEECSRCTGDKWQHQPCSWRVPVPPCQYSDCEKIRYFLSRGIIAKSLQEQPRFTYDPNESYLLSHISKWFEYSYLKSAAELDDLVANFPQHLHLEFNGVFRSNTYVQWLFEVGACDRAMQTIAQHRMAVNEDVVATCIIKCEANSHALQLIHNPKFTLAEVVVVPVQLKSRAALRRMKAEWEAGSAERFARRQAAMRFSSYYSDDDAPEAEDEDEDRFKFHEWEQLPITKEAARLADMSGKALAAAVRRRDFQLTTALLVKGARANDGVWFDDPDAGPKEQTRSFVSTPNIGHGLFMTILTDVLLSYEDKKVWVALLAQFGVFLDYQYYSIVFELQLDPAHEHQRLHWLEVGAKYKANAFPHHLIDAMRHPLQYGYIQWWRDHDFPCIVKSDIYLQGSSLARLPEESRALVTRLWGLVFPKRMDSHFLDQKPTHEVGGECTC